MKASCKVKLVRTATVAGSLNFLLKGQLAFLQKHYDVLAVSGTSNYLDEVAKRERVHIASVPMQRTIRPLRDIISLWQLYRLFLKEKPKIVHSITPKAGLLSMTAAYMARVPIRIHTFTGLIFPSKTGWMQKLLIGMDRILCRMATHIYPEGEGVKQDLIFYKITTKPLYTIANGNVNGIDTQYFSVSHFSETQKKGLKNDLNIGVDDFVFIFVGRLVRDKGINELITAFEKLSGENVKVKLLLVGGYENILDPLTPKTLATIADNKNIISVGFQRDVRPYFSIADALVFPSYREGFPNVVMQAGAMGLPSIVSNINGCNEIITEGKNGLIVPPKDIKALIAAMTNFVNNKILINKLKSNAREMIVDRYEQHIVWKAILAEYKKLEELLIKH